MGKVLVAYFSLYGSTRKYAEWIAAELNGDILDIKKAAPAVLGNYDTIILGSGLYGGQIRGIKTLLKNYETLKGKKLVLFACGISDDKRNPDEVKKRTEALIPEKLKGDMKAFYLRGGMNYGKLRLTHKIIMSVLKKMLTRKGAGEASEEGKDFLEVYGKTVDFTDKNNIACLVNYCRRNVDGNAGKR